jgi:hypothetical protein
MTSDKKTDQKTDQKTSKTNKKAGDKTIRKTDNKTTKHTNFLHKIFGGLNMSWPVVIAMSVILGVYTALMAMLVPDGNSFHDIAVTPEWWVLPAIIIIVNCKKPLESALKVFVFFLISQPLVYLIQVPFNNMGWGLFQYYPYWLKITLATFPAGFVGWYLKKDEWYSGVILSFMTVFLVYTGINYIGGFEDSFPNHFFTTIYCFGIIPVFIFGIFKKWQPRLTTAIITIIATIIIVVVTTLSGGEYYETSRTYYVKDGDMFNEYEFVGEARVTSWFGDGEGDAEVINYDSGYSIKIAGRRGHEYKFTVTDENDTEYYFRYHYDDGLDTVLLELDE